MKRLGTGVAGSVKGSGSAIHVAEGNRREELGLGKMEERDWGFMECGVGGRRGFEGRGGKQVEGK